MFLWVALLAVAIVVGAHIVAWLIYVPIAVRLFAESPWLLCARQPSVDEGEKVTFRTSDGFRLEGTYLKSSMSRRQGVVLFCHELLGDRWNAIPYTEQLRREGYDIFTFDFRNHGQSEKREEYRPMPWTTHYELRDVRAALDYLQSRPDADDRGVFVWGISRGGTAALCALGRDTRVRAMVVDGLVPTAELQVHYTRRFMGIYLRWTERFWQAVPDLWIYWTAFWTRLVFSFRKRCRFADVAGALRRATVPVFLVHGQRDSYVPIALIQTLQRRSQAQTQLWVVPKAKHNAAIRTHRDGYLDRISRFFGGVSPAMAPQPVPPQPLKFQIE